MMSSTPHCPLRLNAPLALTFVRRGCDKPGTIIATEFGDAEITALPIGYN